LCVWWEVGIQI